MEDRDVAAPPLLERQDDRPSQVVDAVPLAKGRPGSAEKATRPSGLGQAQLCGESERALGSGDRPVPVAEEDDVPARQLAVGGDQVGPGRLGLQERDRLGERLAPARVAELREDQREHGQRPPEGDVVPILPMDVDRVLERRSRLVQAALL